MTGIIFATEEEAFPFLRRYKRGRFEELREGETLFDDVIFVTLTGVGKIKATLRTERFLQAHRPVCVFHVGTCTALNDRFQVGDVVAAEQVFEGDRIELATPAYPRMPLDVPMETIGRGTLITQDHVAREKVERSYWQRIADMTDMTGYAVAYVSAMHGVPCHIIKVVTGHVDDENGRVRKKRISACETIADFLLDRLGELKEAG